MNREQFKDEWMTPRRLSDLVPAVAGITIEYLADLPLCIQVKVENSKIHERFNRLKKIAFPGTLSNHSTH